MTLSELAAFVCAKVNQTEADDITAAKGFIRQRRDLIWNDQLWKDSLLEYRQTVAPTGYTTASTWLPAKGVLLLPSIIDRVLAARTDTSTLSVQRPEFYYRVNPDALSDTGAPTDFLILPPCVWEFDVATDVHMIVGNVADQATPLTTDLLATDGISVSRSSFLAATSDVWVAKTERIDAVSKVATTGTMTLAASTPDGLGILCPILRNTDTVAHTFGFSDTDDPNSVSASKTLAAGASISLVTTTIPAWTWPGKPYCWVMNPNGTYTGDGLALPNAGTYSGFITYNGTTLTAENGGDAVIVMAAATTAAPKRQRIRLVVKPDASLTLRVLAKRKPPTFTDDNDEPGINGIDNVLLAFGQADMLERERQYGKAQLKLQEAALLLTQLIGQETVQQAHNQRIMPNEGYGNPYDLWSHPPLTF